MKKVLVVDDDDDIRALVRTMFQVRGWDVDEASSGEIALERHADDYDVVLLDQMMPGITGDQVAVQFRTDGYRRPIIFYSAYLTKELEARLNREVNIDLHIIAKTDFEKLGDVVSTLSSN